MILNEIIVKNIFKNKALSTIPQVQFRMSLGICVSANSLKRCIKSGSNLRNDMHDKHRKKIFN